MKTRAFLLLSLILLAACGETKSPERPFEKAGIAFTSPAGWKITEEDDFDDTGHYLSLEKQGGNDSGLITIMWFEGDMDHEEFMELTKNSLADNSIFDNLTFTDIPDATFNGMTSLGAAYTMSVQGLSHRGTIYVFGNNATTVGVVKQEAMEDSQRNAEGFDVFETSFSLK